MAQQPQIQTHLQVFVLNRYWSYGDNNSDKLLEKQGMDDETNSRFHVRIVQRSIKSVFALCA